MWRSGAAGERMAQPLLSGRGAVSTVDGLAQLAFVVHGLLERLQNLSRLHLQRLGHRRFNPFLDNLQVRASLIELIPEFLCIACFELSQSHLQRALQVAARTAECVGGHLRQAFVQTRLQPACGFVQLRHAAVEISDLLLQAR